MNPSNMTSLPARDAKFRRAGTQAAAAIVLYAQFASHARIEAARGDVARVVADHGERGDRRGVDRCQGG